MESIHEKHCEMCKEFNDLLQLILLLTEKEFDELTARAKLEGLKYNPDAKQIAKQLDAMK